MVRARRMVRKRFKALGEAFTHSMDIYNYLVGRGVDTQLANRKDYASSPRVKRRLTKMTAKLNENKEIRMKSRQLFRDYPTQFKM